MFKIYYLSIVLTFINIFPQNILFAGEKIDESSIQSRDRTKQFKSERSSTSPPIESLQNKGNKSESSSKSEKLSSAAAGSQTGDVNALGAGTIPAISSLTSVHIDPFTGSANLSIPFSVPTGRAGIQPSLSLNYSSTDRKLGLAGVGWNFELGSIQRSTKNGVPSYNDAKDIFMLSQSGSMQNLVADPNNSNIYRLEIEGTFLRIQYFINHWVVTDKNGIKYYYGNTDDSRQYDSSNKDFIFRWALNKVEDLKGNYMSITYERKNGQIYPKIINYTGNSKHALMPFANVEINYDKPANMSNTSYISRFKVTTDQLISSIKTYVKGQLQNEYRFSYEISQNTQRDLLRTIQQFSADGQSLPPLGFSYNEIRKGFLPNGLGPDPNKFRFTFNAHDSWGRLYNSFVKVLDIEGDCYPDLFGVYTSNYKYDKTGVFSAKNTKVRDRYGNYWVNNTLDYTGYANVLPAFNRDLGYGPGDLGIRLTDVNSDGLTDIVRSLNVSYKPATQYGTWLNSGNGFALDNEWNVPSDVVFTTDLQSENIHATTVISGTVFADLNAGGFPDIVKSEAGGSHKVYWNTLKKESSGKGWVVDDGSWVPPDSPYTDLAKGAIMVDINGDILPDFYYIDNGQAAVFLNTGHGWIQDETSPWTKIDNIPSLKNGSTQFLDINSDGLADMVVLSENNQAVYINTGNGWFKDPLWVFANNNSPLSTPRFDDYSTVFVDIDTDGMLDYMIARHYPDSSISYTNWSKNLGNPADLLIGMTNGIGAQSWITYESSAHFTNTFLPYIFQVVKSVTTTTPSVLGNVHSHGVVSAQPFINIWTESAAAGILKILIDKGWMTSISSTQGRLNQDISVIELELRQALKAKYWHQNQIDTIVSILRQSNNTVLYEYSGGLWNSKDREFQGFSTVKVIDVDGNYSVTNYLQDYWLKGRPSEIAVYDAQGNLYTKTINQWQTQDIVSNVASKQVSKFVFQSRADNYLYDSSSIPKRTAQEFVYGQTPQHGDVTSLINYGEVDPITGEDTAKDTVIVNSVYTFNVDNWVISKPKHVYAQDVDGNVLNQVWFNYDKSTNNNSIPTLGNLTSKINWLGSATQPDPKISYTYDVYGNLETTVDPNGNTTTVEYDRDVHMFPVAVINELKQRSTATYYGVGGVPLKEDNGLRGLWGQVRGRTDINDQTLYTVYDSFGRKVLTVSPLDSILYPTSRISYEQHATYLKVSTQTITEHGGNQTLNVVSFYDGLGRLIETKSLGPKPGQYIVSGQTIYDAKGLAIRQFSPRFTDNNLDIIDPIDLTSPFSHTVYDSFGRVVKIINTDNTYITTTYDQWAVTAIDENGHMQKSYVDALGRLIRKEEYSGADGRAKEYQNKPYQLYATTSYEYDLRGNLTKVIDAKNNVIRIEYDALGRKINMRDPDTGYWQYDYDSNGNVIKQIDNKGQTLYFEYDGLNRLDYKGDVPSGPSTDGLPKGKFKVDYKYDDPNKLYSKGRLNNVDYNEDHAIFNYDQLGREINSSKEIGFNTHTVARNYDALNRLKDLTYPDNVKVYYTYNLVGQIDAIYSTPLDDPQAKAKAFVKDIQYNALGQIIQITLGNGVITQYVFNPVSIRLDQIISKDPRGKLIQKFTYKYDAVGQVVRIIDGVNTANQAFKYDHLNRLISATGQQYGTKNYSYDEIGNIITKDGMKYKYGELNSRIDGEKAGPHAVTSLSDGTKYKYDLNGNMVKLIRGGSVTEYSYDGNNRLIEVKTGKVSSANLTKIAAYAYDGDGKRISKTVFDNKKAIYNLNAAYTLVEAGNVGTGNMGVGNVGLGKTFRKKLDIAPTHKVTSYVGNLVEINNNVATKFVYFGSIRIASITDNDVYYYHADYLGSTNVLTDKLGLVRELTEYDPYGSFSRHEFYGIDGKKTAWEYFSGKSYDDETGLIYFGARYYNPKLGRFITPDIIVQSPNNPQTLNRYTYCNNNPVNLTDLTGHSWKSFWRKASGYVAIILGVAVGFINPALGMFVYSAIAASGQSGNFMANFGMNMGASIAGYGVGAMAGSLLSSAFLSGLATAAFGGAAASASLAASTGGDVGMAALAGFAGGVIGYSGGRVWQLGADAIAGGVGSVIQGGEFGEGVAGGALSNGASTFGGLLGPMEKIGTQDLAAGDAVLFKAHNPGAALIAFIEGGIFTHAGTMVSSSEMVEVGLDWKGAQKTNIYTGKDNYKNRSGYVSRQFRGNQTAITRALSLCNTVTGYGLFDGRKICSTAAASSYSAAQSGWYGFDPNTQANQLGYNQFYPTKTYGQ